MTTEHESTPAISVIDATLVDDTLQGVLLDARLRCVDPGLRLIPLVSRRQPHGIAVIFSFSCVQRQSAAQSSGQWQVVQSRADQVLRDFLARRGERAFLTLEADARAGDSHVV